MKRITLFILFALVAGLLLTRSMFFLAHQGEAIIVTAFGDPVRIIKEPGLQHKQPAFLQTVNRFDMRMQHFSTQPIQLLLSDKNPLIITCYVCWQIDDPLLFFQSVASPETARQRTSNMINSLLGSVLGDYTLDQIINTNRTQLRLFEIEQRIQQAANEKAESKYGIRVASVGIERISYPAIVTQAVYKRMQAEREKEAVRYRAEGYEQAAGIRARADTEAERTLAEANREAEIIRGEGDEQAMTIYGEAYRTAPAFFEFINALKLYKTVLNQDSTLILSTESDLFRYLTNPQLPSEAP